MAPESFAIFSSCCGVTVVDAPGPGHQVEFDDGDFNKSGSFDRDFHLSAADIHHGRPTSLGHRNHGGHRVTCTTLPGGALRDVEIEMDYGLARATADGESVTTQMVF